MELRQKGIKQRGLDFLISRKIIIFRSGQKLAELILAVQEKIKIDGKKIWQLIFLPKFLPLR